MEKIENTKIIHYCWFGRGPLNDLAKKCIDSWKKYCPDYEIKQWNEDNFDIHCCKYAEEAYEAKKWAFVSDVARLYALIEQGGIYMDTDVEVIRPLDDLLKYDAVAGFESETHIGTGFISCNKSNPLLKEFLYEYDNLHFIKEDGSYDVTPNVNRLTELCVKYGFKPDNTFQTINGFTFLPKDYLCPKDWLTKEMNMTKNTFIIHHFDGSWLSDQEKYCSTLFNKMKDKKIPVKIAQPISSFISTTKFNGLGTSVKKVWKLVKKKVIN